MRIYIYIYICVCVKIYLYVYVYICIYVRVSIYICVCVYIYIYVHIYICVCIYIYVYVYILAAFFVNTNFMKHNRHFMSTYFLLDPFEFPYYFYRFRGELFYVLSIVVRIPSTFCRTLMMAQSRTESTRDTYNYGQYINQILPNTIKVIREFERLQKKICRYKMSIVFNEICINEEMSPKYT